MLAFRTVTYCTENEETPENAVLLRVSDEPLMHMLNWYHTGEGMAAAKGQA